MPHGITGKLSHTNSSTILGMRGIITLEFHVRQKTMLVGYARTSSLGQVAGLEGQERELLAAGCEKVFREQVSSVAKRDQLEAALDYVREGDFSS